MDEDIGLEEFDSEADEDLVEPAWWAPASLLTTEAAAITAFTVALLGMVGGTTIASVLVQSVVGAPWEQDGWVWYSVLSAGMALVFAAGAVLLARRVIRDADAPGWSGHLARAAVLVAAAGIALSTLAILATAVQGSPVAYG